MRISLRAIGIFLLCFITGTLYAMVVGLFGGPLRAALDALPVWIVMFWLVFLLLKMIRYVGFIWILPLSLFGFELLWTSSHPGMVADKHTSLDRSHYIAGRVKNPQNVNSRPDMYGAGLKEILIGQDGFRADPQTGR